MGRRGPVVHDGPGQDRVSESTAGADLLEWLARAWAPLAAYTFALATGYWFEFRHVFAIPVSFASGSTVAALPALAGIVLGMFVAGMVLMLVPSAALWRPVGPRRRRLIDAHRSSPNRAGWRKWVSTRNLGWGWMTLNSGFTAWVLVAFYALPALHMPYWTTLTLGTAVPMIAVIVGLQSARRRAGMVGKDAWRFNGFLAWVLLVQWLVVAFGTQLAISVAETAPWWLALSVAFDAGGIAIVVFNTQFTFALGARSRWHGLTARSALMTVLVLASLPLAIPRLGAAVAAIPLAINAPDGRSCVVLVASTKATTEDWADITASAGKPPRASRPLPFATLLDSYFVKTTPGGPTLVIPVEQVRRVDACPNSVTDAR